MKKFKMFCLMLCVLVIPILTMQACKEVSLETLTKTSDVVFAIDQFERVKEIVKEKQGSFSVEDWDKIESASVQFSQVADIIKINNYIVSVDQVKVLRDSIRVLYIEVRTIIHANPELFNVQSRMELLSFDDRMVRVDRMVTKLEENPTTKNVDDTMRMMGMSLEAAMRVYPYLK